MMKRVLCVWFPNWPLQRLCAAHPELKGKAIVLYADGSRGGSVVVACSSLAARQGVTPGMPLAEADALLQPTPLRQAADRGVPGAKFRASRPGEIAGKDARLSVFLPDDPRADRSALQRLAAVCQRFSPLAGLEEAARPESLLLDVTGCGPVFGGEENLARLVQREFERRGYRVRVAIADTIGAAWAVAHTPVVKPPARKRGTQAAGASFSPAPLRSGLDAPAGLDDARGIEGKPITPVVIPPGQSAAALQPLPVVLLRLPAEAVHLLKDLGIERIGPLMALPRASLPARLGSQVIDRLDQALGRLIEVLVPYRAPPPIEAAWSFEEPTGRRPFLEAALEQLIERIVEQLQGSGEGVRSLVCWFEGAVTGAQGKEFERNHPEGDLATAPTGSRFERGRKVRVDLVQASGSVRHLMELVRMRLEKISWTEPVATIRVRAAETAPLDSRQSTLFESGAGSAGPPQLALLVDRLTSRLGRRSVLRALLVPDAQPESACRYEPVVGEGSERRTRQKRNAGTQNREPKAALGGSLLSASQAALYRPLQLMPQPQRVAVTSLHPDGPPAGLHWEGQAHSIIRLWGPERVETGWWRGCGARRDYYRIEIDTGHRLWLFRERNDGEWYLHGMFV